MSPEGHLQLRWTYIAIAHFFPHHNHFSHDHVKIRFGRKSRFWFNWLAVWCDCRWEPGGWGKCSKTCGAGIQIRNLRCKQLVDNNGQRQQQMLPISYCRQWQRPAPSRSCNLQTCPLPANWTVGEWGKVITLGSLPASLNVSFLPPLPPTTTTTPQPSIPSYIYVNLTANKKELSRLKAIRSWAISLS